MKALIVVDVQNDFCPGGALAVSGGDQVVPFANRLRAEFPLTVFTQDWHPQNHVSFASNNPGAKPFETRTIDGREQVMWPDHCVQGSPGAEFHPELDVRPEDPVVRKGDQPRMDSYSGFTDNAGERDTGLHDLLQERGVDEVYIVGLAQDVCVLYTALDARRLGYRTYVYREGTRPVDPTQGEAAFQQMADAGATLL